MLLDDCIKTADMKRIWAGISHETQLVLTAEFELAIRDPGFVRRCYYRSCRLRGQNWALRRIETEFAQFSLASHPTCRHILRGATLILNGNPPLASERRHRVV